MPSAHILAVCTGNICRSPAIERLLDQAIDSDAIVVGSAGTAAVVGEPIYPAMARLITAAGADADDYAARQLTVRQIRHADLILTATTTHRAAVAELSPDAIGRSFTLLEFAASLTLPDLPDCQHLRRSRRIPVLVEHARLSRPRLHQVLPSADVPDPYGASDEVFETSFSLIQQAVDTIAAHLAPPPAKR